MNKLTTPVLLVALSCSVNAAMVDLGTWTQEGSAANGTWTLSSDRHSVYQSINGHPTAYVSSVDYDYRVFRGDIRVETTGDDDYIGFVVSYSPDDFIIFDWKKSNQGTALQGFSLIHSTGTLDELKSIGWDIHEKDTSLTTLLARDRSRGWQPNVYYDFQVQLEPGRVIASVDGDIIFDVETDAVKPGKFGFINWSQSDVRYHSIKELHPPIPKSFDLTINQGDAITIDGEWTDVNVDETHVCNLLSEPEDGTVTFVQPCSFVYQPDPDKNGEQTFRYSVTDSTNIQADAEVKLNVLSSGLDVSLPSHLVAGKSQIETVRIGGSFSGVDVKPTITLNNAPSWMQYDELSGRIIMSPAETDLGLFEDIEIMATNGNGHVVAMGGFDIQVIPDENNEFVDQKFKLLTTSTPLRDQDDTFLVNVWIPALSSAEDNLVDGEHEIIVTTSGDPNTIVKYDGQVLERGKATSLRAVLHATGTEIPFEVISPNESKSAFQLEIPWLDSPQDLRYVRVSSCGETDSVKCQSYLESDRYKVSKGEIQMLYRDFDTKNYTHESFDAKNYTSSAVMTLLKGMSDGDLVAINVNTGAAGGMLDAISAVIADNKFSDAVRAYADENADSGYVVFVKNRGVIGSSFDSKYEWGSAGQYWISLVD